MRRTCYMCDDRPARRLVARHRSGATYIRGAEEPVFCSVRCAANWALVHVGEAEGGAAWCRRHGWHNAVDGCFDCPEDP